MEIQRCAFLPTSRCLLNPPHHFFFLGVSCTMNSPNYGKIFTEIPQNLKNFNMHKNSNFGKFGKNSEVWKLRLKRNSFADIGKIGGKTEKSQDMTYVHSSYALLRDFGIS